MRISMGKTIQTFLAMMLLAGAVYADEYDALAKNRAKAWKSCLPKRLP
jgi:hypothetical protein